jgi:D-threo-aldose 1-dehydrogenase
LLQLADPDIFLLAGRYTLLDQSASPRLSPACAARGVGVFIGGAFNSGILATGAVKGAMFDHALAGADVLDRVKALERVCASHAAPLAAAALQFPLAHPAVACVIAGGQTASEVEQHFTALELPIPAEFWRELRHRRLLDPLAPTPTGLAPEGFPPT